MERHWYTCWMFLQIVGPAETPWHERNTFWGGVALLAAIFLAAVAPKMTGKYAPLYAVLCTFGWLSGWMSIKIFCNSAIANKHLRLLAKIGGGLFVAAAFIAIWFWQPREEPRPLPNEWRLTGCSVFSEKDNQRVRLTFHGQTKIVALADAMECDISMETRFERDGGFLCITGIPQKDRVSGPSCFAITSEEVVAP